MIPSKAERYKLERDQRPKPPRRGNGGAVLLLLGIGGALLALNMDTSVSTGYGRVNNLGLMNQQHNYLIASGVIAILGAILLLRSPRRDGTGDADGGNTKKCPQCAEAIKSEALVCRFCGNRDF